MRSFWDIYMELTTTRHGGTVGEPDKQLPRHLCCPMVHISNMMRVSPALSRARGATLSRDPGFLAVRDLRSACQVFGCREFCCRTLPHTLFGVLTDIGRVFVRVRTDTACCFLGWIVLSSFASESPIKLAVLLLRLSPPSLAVEYLSSQAPDFRGQPSTHVAGFEVLEAKFIPAPPRPGGYYLDAGAPYVTEMLHPSFPAQRPSALGAGCPFPRLRGTGSGEVAEPFP